MTGADWAALVLQVVATLAAAAAAIAAWRSVAGVAKERKADALWRAAGRSVRCSSGCCEKRASLGHWAYLEPAPQGQPAGLARLPRSGWCKGSVVAELASRAFKLHDG
jgi:hypothetical protein